MQNFKTLRQTLDHLEEAQLLEKLKASDPTGEWVSDFVDSDDPKFAGKSKKERIQMALGASYAAKRAEGKIKEEAEEFDEELTPMQKTHFDAMNKHRVAAQFATGPKKDMHLTAAAEHERALRNHDSQAHSSSMTSSKKLGVTEEAEQLDEIGDTPAGRKALASYAKTASHDARMKMAAGKDFERHARTSRKPEYKAASKEWEDKYKSDARRREAGVHKAIDRLAKEEVELDEAINHLQMAKHHQALAKEHDRISDAANRRDEPELSDAHGHQSDDHQDAAKAHLQAHKTGNPKDVAAAKKATRRSLQTGSTPGGSIYHVGKYGDYSHKDYNYSNLRSGADAIKKGLKEEVELDESMSAAQIKKLRDAYGNIDKIDVSGQPYKNLVAFLDKQNLDTLKMLAGAKIKFISPLAQNRVVRKMNESIGSTVGGALGQYAGAKIGMEGPGRAHGEVLGRQLEKFARELFKKLTGEEIELDEEETKEFMVKFEKQGKVSVKNYTGKSDLDVRSKAKVDAKRMGMTVASIRLKEEVEEAVNPQKSMKRAGLSVERAKEVMRHQKEIGTIRKKRESLRNSFDPVNTVIEAYKKNKMKKETTAKDKNKTVHSGDKLSGKTEPIEIDPELKEQKT